ncbi:hypothetical protein Tco_1092128 [Tanacetum coccineum]|uniref:Uncharacterized protein n=1 Tax=Tanacetum coccineum TaxID=301880 RepID=A0ABQ5I989_9ASTR
MKSVSNSITISDPYYVSTEGRSFASEKGLDPEARAKAEVEAGTQDIAELGGMRIMLHATDVLSISHHVPELELLMIILQGVTYLVITVDATRRHKKKGTIYIRNIEFIALRNTGDPPLPNQTFQRYIVDADASPMLNIRHQRYDDLSMEKRKKSIPAINATGNKPTYLPEGSYCFKAIVSDGTSTISIPCFSNKANTLTKDSDQVLPEIEHKDRYQLPPSLKELEGTKHTLQFHFGMGSTAKRPDFVLDKVFEINPLHLPRPSVEQVTPILTIEPVRASNTEESTPATEEE